MAEELLDDSRSPAGQGFRRWLESPNGKLVLGGKLTQELGPQRVQLLIRGLKLAGRLITIEDQKVERQAKKLTALPRGEPGACKSNDHHIIALAQLSGARMLFSKDRDLHKDFKNKQLVDNPRGKVYSTRDSQDFTRSRRELLRQHRCNP